MNCDSSIRQADAAPSADDCLGGYEGELAPPLRNTQFLALLPELAEMVASPRRQVLESSRNRTVCLSLPAAGGGPLVAAVKAFAPPSRPIGWVYRGRGSKARRSWRTARLLAERGVGTPAPLAYLERWRRDRLVESYFLTEYRAEAFEARRELILLFSEPPRYEAGGRLLQLIAREVRKLHAAGIQHNDLGHQNILVRRTPDGYAEAQFIDLNRARPRERLSTRQRAADVARLWLPRSMREMFFDEYFADQPVPARFHRWEAWYRRSRMARAATRQWRHPSASRRLRELGIAKPVYPAAELL